MNLKIMKKIASISLAALMAGCIVGNPTVLSGVLDTPGITANALDALGTCGQYMSWRIDGDTLTIGGRGEMRDYTARKAPWYSYASQLKKLIISSDVKVIGNYAFYGLSNLEYIYTKNEKTGAQSPIFPNVTRIGNYAFAECKALRGNTQSGSLTFGDSGAASLELFVGDSAFQNCEKVRIMNSNYGSMVVDKWGFYNMDSLGTVNFGNTTAELRAYAFLYSTSLSSVNIKPSVKPIHKDAFNNTAYYNNGMTTTTTGMQNIGAATQLKGKQLVVNFFVDRTRVNFENSVRSSQFRQSKNLRVDSDEIAIGLPANIHSTDTTVAVFKKNKLTYKYMYGWNPEHTNSPSAMNAAIELNNYDIMSEVNTNSISVNTVKNVNSYGRYGQNNSHSYYRGSYITSSSIANRLNDVDKAMKDLQTQATAYGQSFSYVMNPETNFHITYDQFDWSERQASFQGVSLGYNLAGGYSNGDGLIYEKDAYGGGGTHIGDSKSDLLFQCIKSATQSFGKQIDLSLQSGKSVSAYTEYLKSKYKVDNVVYLIHINTPSQSFASPVTPNNQGVGRVDEFAVICSKTGNGSGYSLAEHEIAHLYGAVDYYDNGSGIPKKGKDFVNTYFGGQELMSCTGTKVSTPTAFSIGWLNRLDTKTYNTFFQW